MGPWFISICPPDCFYSNTRLFSVLSQSLKSDTFLLNCIFNKWYFSWFCKRIKNFNCQIYRLILPSQRFYFVLEVKIKLIYKRLQYCIMVYLAMRRHHNHHNSYQGKHLTRVGLQFQKLLHYHHRGV